MNDGLTVTVSGGTTLPLHLLCNQELVPFNGLIFACSSKLICLHFHINLHTLLNLEPSEEALVAY